MCAIETLWNLLGVIQLLACCHVVALTIRISGSIVVERIISHTFYDVRRLNARSFHSSDHGNRGIVKGVQEN